MTFASDQLAAVRRLIDQARHYLPAEGATMYRLREIEKTNLRYIQHYDHIQRDSWVALACQWHLRPDSLERTAALTYINRIQQLQELL